jgi:hypothetical protein
MRIRRLIFLACLCGAGLAGAATQEVERARFPAADTSGRVRVHELLFTTYAEPLAYRQYYRLNQDLRPYYDNDWNQPEDALQLNSSRVNDCWVQLAGQPPHSLRWDLEVKVLATNVVLVPEPNGVVFQVAGALPGLNVTSGWHRLTMERDGSRLTVRVDETGEAVTFVPPDTRTPLRLTVRRAPLVWLRASALYAAPGEPWATAAAAPATATNIVWQEVYRQPFDTADAMKDFSAGTTNSLLTWVPDANCMRLAIDPRSRSYDAYATFRQPLPGDLRIRFRARNAAPDDQFFGVLIGCRRLLPQEDGYYCEWNRGWLRRIKKADVQRCIDRPSEPEEPPPHWASYQLERAGDTIRMIKNGRLSLAWTDPDPITDPAFSRFAWYNCNVPLDIDDLVIERNARDVSNELAAATAAAAAGVAAPAKTRDPLAADTVIVRQAVAPAASPGGGVQALAQPRLCNLQVSNDYICFQWPVQAGAVYDVETCNSLATPVAWTPVPGWSGVRAPVDTLVFSAPVSESGHCFYRVVARPAP